MSHVGGWRWRPLLLAGLLTWLDAKAASPTVTPCPIQQAPLVGLDLSDGHPRHQRFLAPDRSVRHGGGGFTNHWSLSSVSQPWVSCRYASPGKPLARHLPPGRTHCRVTHDAQAHPVSLQCH